MKSSEEIYKYYTGETLENKQLTKKAMIEYGKQLLIEASERATITLKDVYSEDFTIVKDEIVRYNPKGVNSVYPDDCFKHSMKINSESILNIINELK